MRILPLLLLAACAGARQHNSVTAPLFFVENLGQASAGVRFLGLGAGIQAAFSQSGAVLHVKGAVVQTRFEGANDRASLEPSVLLTGKANFLIGDPEHWRTGIPLYGEIVHRDIYRGIDAVYGQNHSGLTLAFRISSEADPAQIRIRYAASGPIYTDAHGALLIPAGNNILRQEPPVIYQEVDGRQIELESVFRVYEDGAAGIVVEAHKVRQRRFFAAEVLSGSSVLGGSRADTGTGVAVDSTGAVYLTGFTESLDLATSGAVQPQSGGSNDAFVIKLNAAGTAIVYCTYIGGAGDDRAYGIAVDASGAAYLAGSTQSANFPVRNAWQARLNGGRNAFVVKLSPTGAGLAFGTYFGGAGSDTAYGIAVDSSGSAYITGDTTSVNLPATGFQKGYRGVQDAFVAKFNSGGALLYSTYLGGSNTDHGSAIAVDAGGNAYITGATFSTDFPVSHAYQAYSAGGQDAFVAELNNAGGTLVFSTYFGGGGGVAGYSESGQGIAVDAQGAAYVAGITSSANFPTLHPVQAALYGWTDAFAAKFSATGGLVYSTFLGGSGVDVANAVTADSSGVAYVAGFSYSQDFPVSLPIQAANGGDADAFVAALSPTGETLLFSTYFGGSGADEANAIAWDGVGTLYVVGLTQSADFPQRGAITTKNGGNYGAFLAKIQVKVTPMNIGVDPSTGTGTAQIYSFQFSDPNGIGDLSSVSVSINSTASVAGGCAVIYNRIQNTLSLYSDAGTVTSTIMPGEGTLQNSQCTLDGAASGISVSGNRLTLTLSLAFASRFSGAKGIYMQATGLTASTLWQSMGSWTVPAALTLAAESVTPSSGTGIIQTFAFQFSDSNGGGDIAQAWVWINATFGAAANSCMLYYSKPAGGFYLLTDGGSGWTGPAAPGSSGTLSNSQCSVALSASSILIAGTHLSVTLAMGFAGGFAGAKNVYAFASNGTVNSGWQTVGAWTVPSTVTAVTSDAVSPSSGTGVSQTFAFQFSDSDGGGDIAQAWVWINATFGAAANSCMLYYSKGAGGFFLLTDGGATWAGPAAPGSSGTLSNSQCSVALGASSILATGTHLSVTVAMGFASGFAGAKNVYAFASNGAVNSGWQTVGTWNVPRSAVSLTADSVTPSSGSGGSRAFVFQFSDSNGGGDITQAWVWINATFGAAANSCMLYYSKPVNGVFLLTDGGATWAGPAVLGSNGALTNSQCSVSLGGSSVVSAGNRLTMTLQLTFTSAYNGNKNIYSFAANGVTNSGWSTVGTWTPWP